MSRYRSEFVEPLTVTPLTNFQPGRFPLECILVVSLRDHLLQLMIVQVISGHGIYRFWHRERELRIPGIRTSTGKREQFEQTYSLVVGIRVSGDSLLLCLVLILEYSLGSITLLDVLPLLLGSVKSGHDHANDLQR
jgi:hypothetical protein